MCTQIDKNNSFNNIPSLTSLTQVNKSKFDKVIRFFTYICEIILFILISNYYGRIGANKKAMKGLENDIWAKRLITGFGTTWYAFYQGATRSVSEEVKDKIKKHQDDKLGREK